MTDVVQSGQFVEANCEFLERRHTVNVLESTKTVSMEIQGLSEKNEKRQNENCTLQTLH